MCWDHPVPAERSATGVTPGTTVRKKSDYRFWLRDRLAATPRRTSGFFGSHAPVPIKVFCGANIGDTGNAATDLIALRLEALTEVSRAVANPGWLSAGLSRA